MEEIKHTKHWAQGSIYFGDNRQRAGEVWLIIVPKFCPQYICVWVKLEKYLGYTREKCFLGGQGTGLSWGSHRICSP